MVASVSSHLNSKQKTGEKEGYNALDDKKATLHIEYNMAAKLDV